jgi:uncharacterized protein YdcH (DUF465 family)
MTFNKLNVEDKHFKSLLDEYNKVKQQILKP